MCSSDLFSSIGVGELAVICVVLILAVGPERLPTMMKTLGKTMRTLRQASRDIRSATGIDELMRDDGFDTHVPPRKYQQPPGPATVSRSHQPLVVSAASDAAPASEPHPRDSGTELAAQSSTASEAVALVEAPKPKVTDTK